ncbi:hypothetical protein Vau01_068540 [Virgisporangium aurantiacum]|uniref:Integral membrane protein n=2 Tax=Virgisporangium aurantiacum TaxID=175570 RepID=A0A8J4E2X2_9ACTN|nr:hypothetical protein [Virgisporangium aurantiacum]GIJ59338.1 hypothetical protein Vau01_068540 [Virgisporangium aurantiacum]
MTLSGWIALAMAVFGAFSYGVGSILQAVGAMRSTGTVRTLGHPIYLLGVGCDLLAWAASMVALRELVVYQVQSVLAGSLAVTVVAARLVLSSRLRRRDVAAVMITIAALTVLAMSAGPQEPVLPSPAVRLGFCVAAVSLAVIGWGATKVSSPGVVAALAGTAFGGAALCGRTLPMPTESPNVPAFALALISEPLTAALVTFAAAGMLLYTNALQHGQVGPVTAVLWIGEVVAPSAVGIALLGDTVRPGWGAAAAAAGLVTIGAAIVLATAPVSSTATVTSAATAPSTQAVAQTVPAPVAAIGAARPPMWPSVAWHEPSWRGVFRHKSVEMVPFTDQQATTIRWWGPSFTDRQAGTYWWWGPLADPQLIWIPPDRTRRAPTEPVWRA